MAKSASFDMDGVEQFCDMSIESVADQLFGEGIITREQRNYICLYYTATIRDNKSSIDRIRTMFGFGARASDERPTSYTVRIGTVNATTIPTLDRQLEPIEPKQEKAKSRQKQQESSNEVQL